MKFTDKFFRFPIRLYLSKDLDKRDELSEKLGITLPDEDENEIPHVIGWEVVQIEDIIGYGTLFSRGKTLEDVEMDGFDCTLVCLRNGKELGCAWRPEEFEKNVNKHAQMLQEVENEALRKRIEEQTEQVNEYLRQEREDSKRWWQFWK
jgi:hypothetical protein